LVRLHGLEPGTH